jgi:hypothetical protein
VNVKNIKIIQNDEKEFNFLLNRNFDQAYKLIYKLWKGVELD